MESVKALIDKASKVCEGDSALAKRLKVSRALVSLMRSGNRQITPEIAAQLADIAGEDAAQAALDAMIERAKGTRLEKVLRDILGKAVAAGVVGMLATSYNVGLIPATDTEAKTASQTSLDIHRIYWAFLKKWRFIKRCLGVFCFAKPGSCPVG